MTKSNLACGLHMTEACYYPVGVGVVFKVATSIKKLFSLQKNMLLS